ncbi:unnamed protein product [Brassica oleracea]|uniref:Ethylene-responsive nuclear protein n=1 Tax=Brassica oleracea var. oleracea TaxID=109376 RepID=A0A0D3A4N7_BRAOL|nr:PREDICTED: uncharacterized protein LOC106325310 [Brassica oleracea var. oleracea]
MPLPWKKSKSGRISKFVSDLQQSPKRGGSLVVETGFPTSLIHLFFKNRDRLKKTSSKRNNNNKAQIPTGPSHSHSTRQRVASLPLPPPLPASEDPAASKIDESFVCDGGVTPENRNDEYGGSGGDHDGGGGVGGCCVLMVVAIKVFVVAVLALSTKKLAVGITISAFALLFLEFAVPRVLTLLNLCPNAQVRLDSLIRKLIGTKCKDNLESSPSTQERTRNNVSFEIIETFQEPRDCIEETRVPEPPVAEEREVLTIRDVVFTKEKSKSAKLKSKIVKKIVPKKLRSYKKKKKLKKMKEKEEAEGVEIEIFEEGGEGSTTEASSLYSEDITESEVSERYEIGSNPPLLESCEEEEEEYESKRDLTKVMVVIVIALAGLLGGKVLAIVLTVSSCLLLRLVCSKSQTIL